MIRNTLSRKSFGKGSINHPNIGGLHIANQDEFIYVCAVQHNSHDHLMDLQQHSLDEEKKGLNPFCQFAMCELKKCCKKYKKGKRCKKCPDR